MREKLVLVTGATAGIGFHTALGFAAKGARVIITGRNAENGRRAEAFLRDRARHDRVHFVEIDHRELDETRELGARIVSVYGRLDVLVNNVGGVLPRPAGAGDRRASEPYEPALTLNYLAPFALTDALLAAMVTSGTGRIVNVVPRAYERFRGDPFEPLDGEHEPLRAYARAKLLMLLWTFALTRHLEGTGVTVNAIDPGPAWTKGRERLSSGSALYSRFVRFVTRGASAERAGRAVVALGSDPYFEKVSGHHFTKRLRSRTPHAGARSVRAQEDAVGYAVRLIARVVARPSTALVARELAVA